MAKQDDPDNRSRRLLGRVFDRKPPPVPPPAPPEEKGEDERAREESDQRSRNLSNPVKTAFYTGQALIHGRSRVAPGPRNEFARVNEPRASKIEREIQARFKTEKGRNAARAAYDDAGALTDKNLETYERAMETHKANLDRLIADRRPAPPEAALHVNQQPLDAWSAYLHGKAEIKAELEEALKDISVEEFWTPDRTPLIGYSPDVANRFNRAVGPEPALPEVMVTPAGTDGPPKLAEHFHRAAVPPPDIEEDEAAVHDRQGYLDRMNQVPPTPPSGPGLDIDP